MRPLETPVEDMLRTVLRAKADEIRHDAVPALRLPASRSFAVASGTGLRMAGPAARGWRGRLAFGAAAGVVAAVVAGYVAVSPEHGRPAPGRQQQGTAATGNAAAAWVADQVSRSAVVSCDPVLCRLLRAHGIPAGDLERLLPGTPDPLGSDVIVATAAVRSQFGSRLGARYAPLVLASFGTGSLRIDVRAIAPYGAAAYLAATRADRRARLAAGAQLLRSKRIAVSAAARRQLRAGQVDSRLVITIAAAAALQPVSIVAFGDAGPGAGAESPLRSADLARTGRAAGSAAAYDRALRAFLDAQRQPFRAARIEPLRLPGGRRALRVEFAAPSPLGLLQPRGSAGA